MPLALRQIVRVGRNVLTSSQPSPRLPATLLEDCRFCASRKDLLPLLPTGGRVAEIGTDKGTFAKHILERNAPEELHVVDLDTSHLVKEVAEDPKVTVHVGRSTDVIGSFPDSHFDWIYIDADHSFAGCLADAEAAMTKVKPGGYLVFNDFAHVDRKNGRYGVHRAVTQFAVANRWRFAWWAYERNGLYDVALRRPEA
jgi:SAM-dependent methyltransferase